MKVRDYFPLGTAYGKAFCNRTKETAWLVDNISAGKHALLIAPRRYGKSSLAEQAIERSKLPVIRINFNICADEKDVELMIRHAVSALISLTLGPIDKLVNSIKTHVSNLSPSINFGSEHIRLELTPKQPKAFAANVEESLRLLERIFADKNRQAILLFDEFQTVGLIAKGRGVEAAIRNAVQSMRHISIIFSGSNRRLLQTMFDNDARPLYKLCRKLYLSRIDAAHYKQHLNKAAKLVWQKELADKVFDRIMVLTERHPYYVNYLCDVIWSKLDKLPTIEEVDDAWLIVINEAETDANAEIAQLSLGQRKVLSYIANNSGVNLLSAETVSKIGMALSSISGSITALVEKDIIEKRDSRYIIVNPIIKLVMQKRIT